MFRGHIWNHSTAISRIPPPPSKGHSKSLSFYMNFKSKRIILIDKKGQIEQEIEMIYLFQKRENIYIMEL